MKFLVWSYLFLFPRKEHCSNFPYFFFSFILLHPLVFTVGCVVVGNVGSQPQEFPKWNWKLVSHTQENPKKADHPTLVDGTFNKEEMYEACLQWHKVLLIHQNFKSLYRILKWVQSRWSQHHLTLSNLYFWKRLPLGTVGSRYIPRCRGEGKEPSIALVQLWSQLKLMSSWWPPLTFHPLSLALTILYIPLFCHVRWMVSKGFVNMEAAPLAAILLHCRWLPQQQCGHMQEETQIKVIIPNCFPPWAPWLEPLKSFMLGGQYYKERSVGGGHQEKLSAGWPVSWTQKMRNFSLPPLSLECMLGLPFSQGSCFQEHSFERIMCCWDHLDCICDWTQL